MRKLARQFLTAIDNLDMLVNNAGAVFFAPPGERRRLEKTLAVNHLAPFLLTNLLLLAHWASGPGRVVTVASDAHEGAPSIWPICRMEQD